MALADSWIRARGASVRNGAGASSTSFWLRRCREQSRVPTTITLPCVSARTWASTCRGLSRNFSTKHSPRPKAAAAAAEGRLDRDRHAVLLGEREHLLGGLHRLLGAGHQGRTHLRGDVPG